MAACLASIGPADKLRTTYSWPPASLPSGTPAREWYAPLLLAAQVPETLIVDVPCQRTPALRDASDPVTVFATAGSPASAQRFAITRSGDELTYRVGDAILARVPIDLTPSDVGCLYRITFQDGAWSLTGGAETLGGDLGYMPIVSGLFSELDLRAGPAPSAAVTTGVHATRATTWQAIGWIASAVASIVALVLVAVPRAPRRPWRSVRTALRAVARELRAVDAVVGVTLLVWWVLSPAFYDDGWTIARQRGFETSRGFSSYYNGIGTNLPNDYWLDWLQHWVTQSFDTILILRIPGLICLAAVWMLCRWTLTRVAAEGRTTRGLSLWALAAMFLAGVMAWGMTLRPEPIIAVLVTGSLACAIWFSKGGGVRAIALLAALVPLAITGHHAGVVVLAPLVVIAGPILRWARTNIAPAVAIATSTLAILVTLAFVGSDIGQRANDAQATRAYGAVTDSWREEVTRYDYLSEPPYGTPVRRGWVAVVGLAVIAFLLRRRRERASLDLLSATLGISLLLLIATPSKWPWHFGVLLGIAALAVASETIRLGRDAAEARGWEARPFVVMGAALLGLVWAASVRHAWSPEDLRSLDWVLASSWLQAETIALGFALLFACALILTHRRARPLASAPWALATKAALIITLPLIALTVGILGVDAVKTEGWTLTRQNLQTLRDDPGCGFGDDLLVPAMDSVRPLPTFGGEKRRVPRWLEPPPVDRLHRFSLGPSPGGPVESPWYALRDDEQLGIFISGPPGSSNALSFEWGTKRRDTIESLGRDRIVIGDRPHDERASAWRFALASELPQAPTEASAIRVVFENRISRGTAVGVSVPVTYSSETLSKQIGNRASPSLISPTVLPYFPCARQPTIHGGVAEPPDTILSPPGAFNPVLMVGEFSPFMGLLDLYALQRLSLADSDNAPFEPIVFGVDKRIDGAIDAPPDSTMVAS